MNKLPVLALSFGFLGSGALLGISSPTREAAKHQDGREPFRHGPHVSSAWLTLPEVKRDCRACHDYEKGNDPQSICLDCHYKDSLQIAGSTAEFEKDVAGLRSSQSSFDHKDHLKSQCIDCHRPNTGGPAIVPDDIPIPRGFGFCIDCHDPKGPRTFPQATEAAAQTSFLTRLNRSDAMGPGGFRGFRHEDHLSPELLARKDPSACQSCHESVASSGKFDLGEKQFLAKGCERCHVQDGGNKITFETTKKTRPSRTALTFPHDKHLSSSAIAKDASIQKEGCYACHTYDQNKGNFDLKPNFENYSACISCHAHQDWKVEDHGQVDNCAACHSNGFGDMKSNRPSTLASRARPNSFQIRSQAHPLITGEARDASCTKCHVAGIESLPSRIGEKKFSHATHLPEKPQNQDCLSCHETSISNSANAQSMAQSFDMNSCNRCHKGVEMEANFAQKQERQVPLFSHSQHLVAKRKDGKPGLSCIDCHQPDQSKPQQDVGTLSSATNCSQCHDHKQNWQITGGKDDRYVQSCNRCHSSGVPQKGVPVPTERLEIAAQLGSQFHPANTSCSDCHKIATKSFVTESASHVFGTKRNPKVHEKAGTPDNCLCCHWDRQQTPKYQPTSLKPKPNQSALQAVREYLGNMTEGYPGENCK